MTIATGLKCPKCGCRDFRTVKTVRLSGQVRRRRVCRYCGQAVRTKEVIDTPKKESN